MHRRGRHQPSSGDGDLPQHLVPLSKQLAYLLRHERHDLNVRSDGYVDVSDVLRLDKFSQWDMRDVHHVVQGSERNGKARFETVSDGPSQWIRAVPKERRHGDFGDNLSRKGASQSSAPAPAVPRSIFTNTAAASSAASSLGSSAAAPKADDPWAAWGQSSGARPFVPSASKGGGSRGGPSPKGKGKDKGKGSPYIPRSNPTREWKCESCSRIVVEEVCPCGASMDGGPSRSSASDARPKHAPPVLATGSPPLESASAGPDSSSRPSPPALPSAPVAKPKLGAKPKPPALPPGLAESGPSGREQEDAVCQSAPSKPKPKPPARQEIVRSPPAAGSSSEVPQVPMAKAAKPKPPELPQSLATDSPQNREVVHRTSNPQVFALVDDDDKDDDVAASENDKVSLASSKSFDIEVQEKGSPPRSDFGDQDCQENDTFWQADNRAQQLEQSEVAPLSSPEACCNEQIETAASSASSTTARPQGESKRNEEIGHHSQDESGATLLATVNGSGCNGIDEAQALCCKSACGKTWQQYTVPESLDKWWYCAEDETHFYENSSGSWKQYGDPGRPEDSRWYWYNEDTQDYFYTKEQPVLKPPALEEE